MRDAILVVNAGSSSVKFSLFDIEGDTLALALRGEIEGIGTAPRLALHGAQAALIRERGFAAPEDLDHAGAIGLLLELVEAGAPGRHLAAVGHRVVHGGTRFAAPVVVDADVEAALLDLVPLAPLHQPHNLAPIRVLRERLPGLPQVACFDTAFHRTQPALAQAFGLPPEITDRGVRRYGFHGLSYEYVASRLPGLDPRAAGGRVVVAHLGNGASMCALHERRSIATTMGFTALDGLMMGTRPGVLDPGVVLWLQSELALDASALARLLYHQSGLLGVSGISSDMRTLLASREPRAVLAVDLFCYRALRELGSLVAALGGIDALVFTGGIGEHAAEIRARIVEGAAWLGFALDADANARHATRLTLMDSPAAAYVVPTDEALMIARHTRALTARQDSPQQVRGVGAGMPRETPRGTPE
ncbi:MAG: acetate/propionate family kinase [Betaproteobacteria bacterium]|nr:acetate/propionate family kinase [Betaproteobacteria bacterium]